MINPNSRLISRIKLNYPETGEIVFYFRPYLAALERETREYLFAMTTRERQRASSSINVFLLRELSACPPTGLPDFDPAIHSLDEYFSDGNPLKEKLLAEALSAYLGRLLPEDYLMAFRIAAWQHVYFRRTLAALDTKFDNCPFYCDRPELRPAESCETCEYTKAVSEYKELGAELLRKWEPDSRYTFEDLSYQASYIAGLAEFGDRKGYAPNWTITTARLVDIYRAEIVKADRIDEANRANEPTAV